MLDDNKLSKEVVDEKLAGISGDHFVDSMHGSYLCVVLLQLAVQGDLMLNDNEIKEMPKVHPSHAPARTVMIMVRSFARLRFQRTEELSK